MCLSRVLKNVFCLSHNRFHGLEKLLLKLMRQTMPKSQRCFTTRRISASCSSALKYNCQTIIRNYIEKFKAGVGCQKSHCSLIYRRMKVIFTIPANFRIDCSASGKTLASSFWWTILVSFHNFLTGFNWINLFIYFTSRSNSICCIPNF